MKQTFTLSIFFLLLLATAFNLNAQLDPPYGTCGAVAGPFAPPDGAVTEPEGNFIIPNEENAWSSYTQTPSGGSLPDNAYVFDAINYEGGVPIDTTLVISYDYTVDLQALGLTLGDVLHAYSFTYDIDTINQIAIDAIPQCEVIETLTGNDQVCEILTEFQDNGGFQTLDDAITLAGLFFGEVPSVADAVFYLDTLNIIIVSFGEILGISGEVCFAYDGFTEILIKKNVSTQGIEAKPIDVYPNPSNNFINVDLNGKAAISKIEVYDANGQLHLLGFNQKLNISSLPLGVYTLHVQTVDNQLYQNRFVKTE